MSNHAFHEPTAIKSPTVASTGRHKGKIILIKIVKSPYPSICADSIMLSGMEPKYVLIIIKLNALTIPGMMYTQNVLIIPRLRIRKKVGIRPAFTYIDSTSIIVKGLRKTNFFLERTKAIIAVKNTPVTMLIIVLQTDMKNA